MLFLALLFIVGGWLLMYAGFKTDGKNPLKPLSNQLKGSA